MMSVSGIQIVGALAAIASTISFVPQAWKVISTRSIKGLSRPMYALTMGGFALWLAYGVGKQDWALIVPNSICLAMTTFIFIMLMMPTQKREAVANAVRPEPDSDT